MNIRVIVVDDEAIIRKDIVEILDGAGFDVVGEAADGVDAIELCESKKPDVVLLDVRMPIMDGLTASKLIKEADSGIAIVMLTAYSDEKFVDLASEYGANGYLVKPLDEKTLVTTISVAVRRCRELVKVNDDLRVQKQKFEDKKIIDQAKSVLMTKNRISEEEAYNYLRTVSMNKRTTIRKISETIVNTDRMLNGCKKR